MMWRASYPHLSKIVTAIARIEWFHLYKSLTILLPWSCISFSRRAYAHRRPYAYCQNKHRQRQFYFLSLAFGTKTRSWGSDVLCRVPTKQWDTGVRVISNIIPPSKPSSSSLLFFVNSSPLLNTYRAPLSSFVNEKYFIFSSLRFCLPRWQKYSIISKKTLFWRDRKSVV